MNRILTLKPEYEGKGININVKGQKINLDKKSQNYYNIVYNMGFTQYFDIVSSVSLVDDTIEVINDQPTAVFEGLFDITPTPEVTPTPALKKKGVAANPNNN